MLTLDPTICTVLSLNSILMITTMMLSDGIDLVETFLLFQFMNDTLYPMIGGRISVLTLLICILESIHIFISTTDSYLKHVKFIIVIFDDMTQIWLVF